jgi:xylulokinase
MAYTLGIDIGTYETKGVLVDEAGHVVAQAARGHQMLVPEPGWAEHRPDEDWWGDFVFVCRAVLAESGVAATEIKAVACSAIGPCMLPVDAAGNPLMNGVLYGVDTRAEAEVQALTDRIGEDLMVEKRAPGDLRANRRDFHLDELFGQTVDRGKRDRPLHGGQFRTVI